MPYLVKIGWTSGDAVKRAAQLSSHTAAAAPFKVYALWIVQDGPRAERVIHKKLIKHRVNKRREFFRLRPETAKELIELELQAASLLVSRKFEQPPRLSMPIPGHNAKDQYKWWKHGG
jgi:hypothetical protein